MRKGEEEMKTLKITVGLLLVSVLLVGCGFKSTLKKEQYASLDPLRAAAWGKEATYVRSYGTERAAGPLGMISPVLGVTHATVTYLKERDLAIEVSAVKPGLMESVVQKFVSRAPQEIPGWPAMTIEQGVDSKYLKNLKNNLILFKVSGFLQAGNTDYVCEAKISVYNKEGEIVWTKKINYNSSNYGRRSHQLNDLVASDFALLKEEVDFAANVIVSQIIDGLKK